jgi:hypothetical protein
MPPCVATIRDADEITLVSDALSALILCLLAAKRYGVEDFVPNNDAQISLDERKLALEARKIEGELEIRGQELQAKVAENSWLTKLASPLTTTVIAGVLTLAASVAGTLFQGRQTLNLEREKFRFSKDLDTQKQEHELVLKMISVGDVQQARTNIQFLAETGLIKDKALAERILKSNANPVLPAPAGGTVVGIGSRRCAVPFVRRPTEGNAEAVELDNDWVAKNLVEVKLPQLEKWVPSGSLRFNVRAADALKAAWAEIEQKGLLGHVVSFDGAFVPRTIRGSAAILSNHACGIAFDINAASNPLGARPIAPGLRGSVIELVPIFEKHGFFWGGNFSGRPEGNHFEFRVPPNEEYASQNGR